MDVSSMNTLGDLQPTVVPDSSIGTDIWTSLTEMLSATGKEFVVLTADRKCREGTTFGSTLGNMFLDENSEILTKFINFCAEHFSLADGIQITHDTYVTENKHLDLPDLDTEGQSHNTFSSSPVKHLVDQDYKPINDTDFHQTNEKLTIVSIPEERMENSGDIIVNLNSKICFVDEVEDVDSNENITESEETVKSLINSNKLEEGKSDNQYSSKMKSTKFQKGRRTLAKEKQREINNRTKKVDNKRDETTSNIRRSSRLAGARNSKFGGRGRQAVRQGRKKDNPDSCYSTGGDSEDVECAKIECPACGTLLANQNNFVKHVLSDHQLEKKSRTNSKKISWTVDSKNCPVCGQFAEPDDVNSHIFVHCSDVLKYPCNRCPFMFLKKSKLVDHQLKEHPGIDTDTAESLYDRKGDNLSDQYECQECSLKFTTEQCLQKHMITHDSKKSKKLDLECGQCALRFKTRSSLKKHMKSHTDENVNKCNIRQEEFVQKDDLKKHTEAHQVDNSKQFKCEICERLFKSRSGMRMHKLFSHGDKGLKKCRKNKFECRFCGGILGSYHTLIRHEARHEQDNESQIQKMGSLMEMATCKVVSVEELRVKDLSHSQEKSDIGNTVSPETDTSSKSDPVLESNDIVSGNAESHGKDTSTVISKELTQESEVVDEINSTKGTDNLTLNESDGKEKQKFECKICQLDFPSQQFLKEHKKIHVISGKSPYACDLCGKIFLRSLSLYKHRQLHDTSGKFTCKTCLKQFNSIESLRRHAKNHLDVKPYICTVCGKGCTEKRNLDTHMLVHTQKKEFICEVCGKAYRTQQQLKEHRYIHTGERPHKCKVCEMAFRSQDVLRNHMALHSEFKKFMCHTCGKTFRQQSCLITHQHTHSNEPTHVCNVCGQGCKSSGALNSHYVSFHLKPEDVASYKWSVYVCEVCNKMFGEKQDHERHMRTHTGEKPYKCEICQKMFADKSNLRSHIRNHNGDRSKKCQICGKGFMFNRDLKKHLLSHGNKMRVPMLDNVTMETALQESIVPAVDNIVTVITQTDALPPESHDQLVPPVSESYDMVTTSLPLGSNLTANLPPMNAENISAVSLMQEATMVHMGVYSNTGDLTWHSL